VLKDKPYLLGPFMKTSDPAMVEIAGLAGFDFVILDMEHGPVSYENLQNLIRAAENRKIIPIVRVPENNASCISKALDLGAQGIQVPQISTMKDAEAVVSAVKFFPHGHRGVCRFVRAAHYSSKDRFEYFNGSNTDVKIIIHLEGKDALDNFESMVLVQGIDIFFLGPYDLSQSIGHPGEVDHPEVEKLMQDIVKKARGAGKYVGTFVESPENAKKWISLGVKYISYSVDVGIYFSACKEIVQTLKMSQFKK
jgi:4-hydroxy-2-oxoheptanedioate aldolase